MSRSVYTARMPIVRHDKTIVDCDVHQAYRSLSDIYPYLSRHWIEYTRDSGFSKLPYSAYPKVVNGGERLDARPPDGGPAGSDLALMRRQLLDQYGIECAILTGNFQNASLLPNADFAAAYCRAVNDWTIDCWLERDGRLRGSLTLPLQDIDASVKEVRRIGEDPRIVQVLLSVGSNVPYGNRQFDPLWRACEELGLRVALHTGGTGVMYPPTAVGWPSYYIEWHTNLSQVFQAQLVSLVCEGTFEKFGRLGVALLEGGFTWLPHVMWRLDKNWRGLRREVPWLKRPPSEYIRDHVRLTTQPIEEPARPESLLDLIHAVDAEGMLMYASDYPHWDFDAPVAVFPTGNGELKRRIASTNALDFYGL